MTALVAKVATAMAHLPMRGITARFFGGRIVWTFPSDASRERFAADLEVADVAIVASAGLAYAVADGAVVVDRGVA